MDNNLKVGSANPNGKTPTQSQPQTTRDGETKSPVSHNRVDTNGSSARISADLQTDLPVKKQPNTAVQFSICGLTYEAWTEVNGRAMFCLMALHTGMVKKFSTSLARQQFVKALREHLEAKQVSKHLPALPAPRQPIAALPESEFAVRRREAVAQRQREFGAGTVIGPSKKAIQLFASMTCTNCHELPVEVVTITQLLCDDCLRSIAEDYAAPKTASRQPAPPETPGPRDFRAEFADGKAALNHALVNGLCELCCERPIYHETEWGGFCKTCFPRKPSKGAVERAFKQQMIDEIARQEWIMRMVMTEDREFLASLPGRIPHHNPVCQEELCAELENLLFEVWLERVSKPHRNRHYQIRHPRFMVEYGFDDEDQKVVYLVFKGDKTLREIVGSFAPENGHRPRLDESGGTTYWGFSEDQWRLVGDPTRERRIARLVKAAFPELEESVEREPEVEVLFQ